MLIASTVCALALLLSNVAAQAISVPSYYQSCRPVTLSWQPTTAPYQLTVQHPNGQTLSSLQSTSENQISWPVDLREGTQFAFTWTDGAGLTTTSMPQTVASGGSNECLQYQQPPQQATQRPGVIVQTVATVTTTIAGPTPTFTASQYTEIVGEPTPVVVTVYESHAQQISPIYMSIPLGFFLMLCGLTIRM